MAIEDVDRETFFAMFDPDTHAQLEEMLGRDSATGIVAFENLQMDSSSFGARSAVIVGPTCTFTSIEACSTIWLKDLPSERQYPVAAYRKPNAARH